MIATPEHKLEQRCSDFTQRHQISAYETSTIAYDGGEMLCIEAASLVMNRLFDMEEQALTMLRDCGLELLMVEGVKGEAIKLYVIPAA